MDSLGMLRQQFETVNIRFHHVAKSVTPELMVASVAPGANPVGFLLWHMARTQDWGMNTVVRGVPEVIHQQPWADTALSTVLGTGTAFGSGSVQAIAANVDLDQLMAYADAVHQSALGWIADAHENDLDAMPAVEAHNAAFPEYQRREFLEELDSGPEHDAATESTGGTPAWLYLTSVCVTHMHRHLGELDLTLGVLIGRAG
jgi:hypothetical protein